MLAELLVASGLSAVIGALLGRALSRPRRQIQVQTIAPAPTPEPVAAPIAKAAPPSRPVVDAVEDVSDFAVVERTVVEKSDEQTTTLRARLDLAGRSEAAAVAERDDLLAERDAMAALSQAAQQRAVAAERERDEAAAQAKALEAALATTDSALAQARADRKVAEEKALAGHAADASATGQLEADLAKARLAERDALEKAADLARERDSLRREADRLRRELAESSAPEPEPVAVLATPYQEAEEDEDEAEAPSEQEKAEGELSAERAISAALHLQVRALSGARARAQKLAKELRETRARLIAAEAQLVSSAGEGAATDAFVEPGEAFNLTTALERLTARAALPGVQAAVLATDDGLLVFGGGTAQESLAALACEVARTPQATESGWSGKLPIGELLTFEVADAHGLHLTVQRVSGPQPLLLATLWQDRAAAQIRDTAAWEVAAWDPAQIRVRPRRRPTRPHQRTPRVHRKAGGRTRTAVSSSPHVRGSTGKPHKDVE